MLKIKFTARFLQNKSTFAISIKMVQIYFQYHTLPQSSESIFVHCECVSYLRTICFYAYRKSLISKPKFTQIRIRLFCNEFGETVEAVTINNNFVIWIPQKWYFQLCSKKTFICACMSYHLWQTRERPDLY